MAARPSKELIEVFGVDPLTLLRRRGNPAPEARLAGELRALSETSDQIIQPASPQASVPEDDMIRQMQISDPWDASDYVESDRALPNPYPPVNATSNPQQVYVATNADVGGSGNGQPPKMPPPPSFPDIEGSPAFAGKRGILDRLKQIPILKNAIDGYEFQGRARGDDAVRGSERFSADQKYSNSYLADLATRAHIPDVLTKNPQTGNLEPVSAYKGMNLAERAAIPVGRLTRDIVGMGSQSLTWNMHPQDVLGTLGHWLMKKTRIPDANVQMGIPGLGVDTPVATYKIPSSIAQPIIYGAGMALGLGSGNLNPLNLGEGGRQSGFQAVTPNEDDPRKSDNAFIDMTVQRGLLGRTGRLLPWEQFRQERPDVDYETYAKYQDYLKDQGILGIAKGTLDGVDGAEARIVGYRVTPMGAIAAAGVLGSAALAARSMRRGG